MKNIWQNRVNFILQDDSSIEFKLHVQYDCSAHRNIPNCIKIFMDLYRSMVCKCDLNINFYCKMYGSVHFNIFFNHKAYVIVSCSKRTQIEFIEKYKTPSKYVWICLDLRCEKVTSTSVPIIKCMGKY